MHFSFSKIIKISLFIILILFIIGIILIETTLQPILHTVCETDVIGMLTTIINQATNQETDSLSYNDLISIETNRQGHIILMKPHLQVVNDISSNITLRIQEALDNLNNRKIGIPISQIFGIEILSQFGPSLTAHIIPYGSVKTNIIDEFESVGINQSKHKIYLEVKTKVRVVVPMISTDIRVDTDIPLTEAVIVGQVPQVYVGLEEGIFEKGIITNK